MRKSRLFELWMILFVCLLAPHRLSAQEAWQRIRFAVKDKPITTLKGIGVKGVMDSSGHKFDAYVLLYGRERSGYLNLGIVVDKINEIVPNDEIDEFRPPDLPDDVVNKNAISICVSRGDSKKCFSTPMAMMASLMLPDVMRGKADYFFVTNIRSRDMKIWHSYLSELCNGYEFGSVSIGNGFFSKPVKVDFTGKGIEPLLKDLIRLVEK
ncbi:MAG: hypothetical protein ABSE21_08290 [Bryobacteraceae bacterium]